MVGAPALPPSLVQKKSTMRRTTALALLAVLVVATEAAKRAKKVKAGDTKITKKVRGQKETIGRTSLSRPPSAHAPRPAPSVRQVFFDVEIDGKKAGE